MAASAWQDPADRSVMSYGHGPRWHNPSIHEGSAFYHDSFALKLALDVFADIPPGRLVLASSARSNSSVDERDPCLSGTVLHLPCLPLDYWGKFVRGFLRRARMCALHDLLILRAMRAVQRRCRVDFCSASPAAACSPSSTKRFSDGLGKARSSFYRPSYRVILLRPPLRFRPDHRRYALENILNADSEQDDICSQNEAD